MTGMFQTTSFPAACMDYFGKRPGTGSADFIQELKTLTDEDKRQLRELLREVGYKNI